MSDFEKHSDPEETEPQRKPIPSIKKLDLNQLRSASNQSPSVHIKTKPSPRLPATKIAGEMTSLSEMLKRKMSQLSNTKSS